MNSKNTFEELGDDDFVLDQSKFQRISMQNGKNARVYFSKLSDDAPNLVFVHGFNYFCEMYSPFLRVLEKEYNLLAFDLPGHGKTDFYDNYDLEVFQEFILELILHFNFSTYYMAGHSMGGLITLANSQSSKFEGCQKFVAYAPAGVRIIESANQRFAKSKCGGCMGKRFVSIATSKCRQEAELRSFSRMPETIARNLRRISEELVTPDRFSGNAVRIVQQVQLFPWNGLFTKDPNSERVRVILARDDAYIDVPETQRIMKESIVLETIHENCIVCPVQCANILHEFI